MDLRADFIALSETSAVQRTQLVTSSAFRKVGFKAHWGAAVQPHTRRETDTVSMRGLAAGVALAARLPSRAARPPMSQEALATCRLSDAFVRLGALEVRVITIYGVPQSETDSRDRTNALLQQAFHRAVQCAVPCIVAGDFNVRPFELPAGQAFQSQGYQDVFDLHQGSTGTVLPATCKGSTRHDTAILHPTIVRLWKSAWVVDRQLFDSHNPLCFKLSLCQQRPCTRVWRLPKPWSQLGVEREQLSLTFSGKAPALRRQIASCASREDVGCVLQSFSRAAEDAVSEALRRQHEADPIKSPVASLPMAFRGRCQPRALQQKEAAALCRTDWAGGYDPDVEVTSVLARLKVRQVRRLITFQRGLEKWRAAGPAALPRSGAQLVSEWRAILNAKGYPPSFPAWTLQVACFHQFYRDLPPQEWLSDLLAYVRYDCDCVARQEAKRRKDTFLSQVSVDAEVGGSRQGFCAIRSAPNPPFTEVPCTVCSPVVVAAQTPDSTQAAVAYDRKAPGHFREGPADLNGVRCWVHKVVQGQVELQGANLPADGQLTQDYVACSAPELHSAFADFWGPLWQRDQGQRAESIDEWPHLREAVLSSDFAGANIDNVQGTQEQWCSAVRKLANRKATGVCGWAPSDLKLLPDEALEVLRLVFCQAVRYGLPASMLQARVCVLAKALCPEHIKQSRPITIFSTLYRLWASIITKNLLRSWRPVFPKAVAGSMPGRSSRDVSYRQQHWIELALLSGTGRYGFSLDIVKCFNQLGWPPLRLLLCRAGMPTEVVDFWLDCLKGLRRHSSFLGDLSVGVPCYNGAPEGDPISVAALAVICAFAASSCQVDGVEFDTYVDNWGWSSTSCRAIERAIPKALDLLQSLALPVDWKKSYTWATTTAGRKWWKAASPSVFPASAQVPAVSEVRDLGVAFKFDGCAHAASRGSRLQDGVDRLERLRQQPRSPVLKASMIQRGVWPACLYGAEGHSFQLAELHRLRSHAARTIVGQHKVLSPFLALAALSPVCVDPQVYCLEQQLQLLRRTCLADPDLAMSVLAVATTGAPKSCQGPATALRQALDRLDLTLTSAGVLKGLDNTWVDLTCCHRREIRLLLNRTWALHIQGRISHRNGLEQAPPPHAGETGRLLSKFSAQEQMVIARHVTGAFSSAAAKQLWDPDCPGTCPLCGARQTKEHKFLHCPQLQHVRTAFQETINTVAKDRPEWIHAPFAAAPSGLEVSRLIFATRSLLPPNMDLPCAPLLEARNFLRFFTDGSCKYPEVPEASHAGFAVVLDTSVSDTMVPSVLANWRATNQPPTEFRIVHQGLVPGLQSINRAEVCGIIQALRLISLCGSPEAEIWTDSSFAIAEWEKACNHAPGTWPDLADHLRRYSATKVRLRKVASHQDLRQLVGLDQWIAAGNSAADVAAKAAVQRDLDCVLEASAAADAFVRAQRRLLHSFWKYLLQLSLEEARLIKLCGQVGVLDAPVAPSNDGDSAWIALNVGPHVSWNISAYQRGWLLACSWRPDFTIPLWFWLRSLTWSVQLPRGRGQGGVTYVELLVHFVIATGQCPPSGLAEPASTLQEADPLLLEPTTLRQLTHSLTEAVRQLERLSGQALWPPRRGKVFSLRCLGCRDSRIGLTLRPFFADTSDNLRLLHQVVQTSSVSPLQSYCRNRGVKPSSEVSDLLRAWNLVNASQRANLARSLRRCR